MKPKIPLVHQLSAHLRGKRDVRLRAMIEAIHAKVGHISMLDMGGTQKYWRRLGCDFLRANDVTVTVLNSEGYELSQEEGDGDLFIGVEGDACHMPQYADNQFDLAHSNSVIEHVYSWKQMTAFASETHRVAEFYYVQTPYFWFPIDPHFYRAPFFHWMPREVRIRLLQRFGLTRHIPAAFTRERATDLVDHAKLFTERKLRQLFPTGDLRFEHFLGLRKSMVITLGPAPAV